MLGKTLFSMELTTLAFDLLKLHILQEALAILKECTKPRIGMCEAIAAASEELLDITYSIGYHPVKYIVPVVTCTIRKSVAIRYALENPDYRYLWKLSKKGKKKRIRYLERLIEDEISGTYFMR
jgi:hypothetical protein